MSIMYQETSFLCLLLIMNCGYNMRQCYFFVINRNMWKIYSIFASENLETDG